MFHFVMFTSFLAETTEVSVIFSFIIAANQLLTLLWMTSESLEEKHLHIFNVLKRVKAVKPSDGLKPIPSR